MHVAYVCADPGAPVFGSKGCSVHVRSVVRAFLEMGSELTLFALRTGGGVPPDFEKVRVAKLPETRGLHTIEREKALHDLNFELMKRMEDLGPFDLVYERHALWSFAAMNFARRSGLPGILEVNAPLVEEQDRFRELFDRAGAEKAARLAMNAATRIVAVSDQVAHRLKSQPEIAEKVIVVPNGVDVDRFKPSETGRGKAEGFTIGFVGTLKPWHGLDDLLAAFRVVSARDRQARLLIVGDGPEKGRIESKLEEFRLRERADITGKIPHEEVPQWVSLMDVAVAPYSSATDCYFSPLKLYEYMASGIPIVASDTGQISTTIQDGVNGLLYQPGDTDGLARAILSVKSSTRLASELGRAARRDAVCRHTWSASLRRILASLDGSMTTAAEVL